MSALKEKSLVDDAMVANAVIVSIMTWHRRYGHIIKEGLEVPLNPNYIPGLESCKIFVKIHYMVNIGSQILLIYG